MGSTNITITLVVSIFFSFINVNAQSSGHVAGVRSSRVLGSYPNRQFPSSSYWIQSAHWMSGKFLNTQPVAVWIVSLAGDNGESYMSFPSDGKSYPNVFFTGTDYNEPYLSAFDGTDIKVWLQVESGSANVDSLIDLVLSRYHHHSSVIGFGIDVEWLDWKSNSGGRKLTDSLELKRWEERVKKYDPSYTLFVKHYAQSWMPSKYRGDLIFIDDSQQFQSLSSMVNEFKSWNASFAPNKTIFQFGYPVDSTWWKQYSDPPLAIGSELLAKIPGTYGLLWVDFTLTKVFPITRIAEHPMGDIPMLFAMEPAYPNPFNPSTTIRFSVPEYQSVQLSVVNILGETIVTLVDETMSPGSYSVQWNGKNIPSGVYFCRLQSGSLSSTQKIVFVQ